MICQNILTSKMIPFERSFASHPRSKCWSDKNITEPREVFLNSRIKFWFDCDVCKHEFETNPNNVNNGCFCPFCANKKLCENPKCKSCFGKSFASHPKAEYWSDKNTTKPRDIFKSSGKKFWFVCDICNHLFEIKLDNVNHGEFCPFCASKKLCDDINCQICFKKSFASYSKAICWGNENNLKPRYVFLNSNMKFSFECDICKHKFSSSLNNITGGEFCPYCSKPPQKLCDNSECKLCFEKSFANHLRSKNWSKKNKLKPRDVFLNCGRKFWFECDICDHEFEIRLDNVNNGEFCPFCIHKTETKLYDLLKDIYPSLIRQYRIDSRGYLFDFFIPEHKIIIELDGAQHFEQISNWVPPEETFHRDLLKMQKVIEHNISIIRILQEDVLYDKYSWLEELKGNINKILSTNKPQKIFMCKNDEYHKHRTYVVLKIKPFKHAE